MYCNGVNRTSQYFSFQTEVNGCKEEGVDVSPRREQTMIMWAMCGVGSLHEDGKKGETYCYQ